MLDVTSAGEVSDTGVITRVSTTLYLHVIQYLIHDNVIHIVAGRIFNEEMKILATLEVRREAH